MLLVNLKKLLISIVVPVYNNENRIHQCVESLLNQTLNDIEIILIDDGSSDQSGIIIDEMKSKDSRIKAIHQENKGVSNARNIGIELAEGRFIGFIDSDDYVDCQMYEKLYNKVISENSSMGMCRFCIVDSYLKKEEMWNFNIEDNNIAEYMFKDMIGKNNEIDFNTSDTLMGSVCRCIYDKNILNLNNIRFDEDTTYAEDLLFNLKYIKGIKNISLINEPLYYYHIKKDSLSSAYRENFYTIIRELMVKIEKISDDYTMDKRINYAWFKYLIEVLRNLTINVSFFNSNRYRKLKAIVNDKENTVRLKNIRLKKLNMKNKFFYIILNNNSVFLMGIFYMMRYIKDAARKIIMRRI